jgi:hypothetical protein
VPRTKKGGAILPVPQYASMAWCSVKAREQLYLIIIIIVVIVIVIIIIVIIINYIHGAESFLRS